MPTVTDWSEIYWITKNLVNDSRFDAMQFGALPSYLIDSGYTEAMRAVNRDSMSAAYVAYLTYCVNSSKDTPQKDLSDFLPFPKIVGEKTRGKKLHIATATKLYLKTNFNRLPLLVQVALEQYKDNL